MTFDQRATIGFQAAQLSRLVSLRLRDALAPLGLMPAQGSKQLAIDDRQRAALGIAANVAVSDEPRGGSPTGAPTGPVLFVAPLARG